ncbi:hypothetical protein EDB85DRAFT_1895512 [Lactarius pseudohatsudake]|nr:hypothetical protein EDB85DRAFT_1895512 [Lactarius pseudohatsudake]
MAKTAATTSQCRRRQDNATRPWQRRQRDGAATAARWCSDNDNDNEDRLSYSRRWGGSGDDPTTTATTRTTATATSDHHHVEWQWRRSDNNRNDWDNDIDTGSPRHLFSRLHLVSHLVHTGTHSLSMGFTRARLLVLNFCEVRGSGSGSAMSEPEPHLNRTGPRRGSRFGLRARTGPRSGSGFGKKSLRTGPHRTAATLVALMCLQTGADMECGAV